MTTRLARLSAGLALAALLAGCGGPGPGDATHATTAASPPTGQEPTGGGTPTVGGTPSDPARASQSATRVSSAPGSPLVVALDMADPTAFFAEGTAVTLRVSGSATSALRAGLQLPPGVELLSGDVSFDGALGQGETVQVGSLLRAREGGAFVLRAWAEAEVPVGSRVAPSLLAEVALGPSGAKVAALEAPPPAFRVTLSGDETGRLTATIAADASADARLAFVVPDAFPKAGTHEEDLPLSPDAPTERTLEMGAPRAWPEGYQVASVYLYPEAALDGRLYSASLYYWWEGGALRVSDAPPRD